MRNTNLEDLQGCLPMNPPNEQDNFKEDLVVKRFLQKWYQWEALKERKRMVVSIFDVGVRFGVDLMKERQEEEERRHKP